MAASVQASFFDPTAAFAPTDRDTRTGRRRDERLVVTVVPALSQEPGVLASSPAAGQRVKLQHRHLAGGIKLGERSLTSEGSSAKRSAAARRNVSAHAEPDAPELEGLAPLLVELQHRGGEERRKGILERFREQYEDVSDQFEALSRLARRLEENEDADPQLRETVALALKELEEAHGPQIRAGLNVAGAVAKQLKDTGLREDGPSITAHQWRELYRDVALSSKPIDQTYRSVIEKYGIERFPHIIEFLIEAAGDDLNATGPSTSKEALNHLLTELYNLEVLATVHERCARLFEKTQRLFGDTEKSVGQAGGEWLKSTQALMGELIGYTQNRLINRDRVLQLAERLGVRNVATKIFFVRELKEIARLIPLKIYPANENRDALRAAIQEALDNAIDSEP